MARSPLRPTHYRLDPVTKLAMPVDSLLEWARAFEFDNRHVGDDTIGELRVSTVFLGLDHGWNQGPEDLPVLFETMVFVLTGERGGDDMACERWCTWHQARAGHERYVAAARQMVAEAKALSVLALQEAAKDFAGAQQPKAPGDGT